MRDEPVAVIGLGPVGLTLALVLAEAGAEVIGVEADPTRAAALARGESALEEPGLADLLARMLAEGRFRVQAVPSPCPVQIIAVGTPLDPATAAPDLTELRAATAAVAKVLRAGDLVILRSTVPVGATRTEVAPILAATGVAHDLVTCPERTLEGAALAELRSLPQILGGLTPQATDRAAALFGRITPQCLPVSTPEAAEIAKLAGNTLRDLQFAFANEIALLAEASRADMAEIVHASTHLYPRAGLARPGPVGGPCLSKDPGLLTASARALGLALTLPDAGRQVNAALPERIVARLAERIAPPGRIALIGLAFKARPEVADLRGTPALGVIAALRRHWPGAALIGADPRLAPETAAAALGIDVAPGPEAAAKGADLALLLTDTPRIDAGGLRRLAAVMAPGGTIHDCWPRLPADSPLPNRVAYLGLGRAAAPGSPA